MKLPPLSQPARGSRAFLRGGFGFSIDERDGLFRGARAFTLVELLAVIAVILVMMALLVPAFTGIKGAGDLTKAAYDISGTLEQARAYAMANNTFVYVGFTEVDASVSPSASQQKGVSGVYSNSSSTPYGRIAVAVIASKDGTRGYDVTSNTLASPVWTSFTNFVALGTLQHFENLHLSAKLNGSGNTPPTTGGMARPAILSNSYVIGNMTPGAGASVTTFSWPLGSVGASAQYQFYQVINFDPQGVARVQTKTNNDEIGQYMEAGLQPTKGNILLTGSSAANVAAIQIDPMSGSTHIYRP